MWFVFGILFIVAPHFSCIELICFTIVVLDGIEAINTVIVGDNALLSSVVGKAFADNGTKAMDGIGSCLLHVPC